MRIVCAPDSFKGSLSAPAAADAMARGIRRVHPDAEIDLCPIADGGEGTMQTLVGATKGHIEAHEVSDPFNRPIEASFGWLGDESRTAVIEMAAASGLTLISTRERNPLRATTFGTGQLLGHALDVGARRILLTIGGSATNDGGCGAAQAVGVQFFDAKGLPMLNPIEGSDLIRIHDIDLGERHPALDTVQLVVCCDVDNPLVGPRGAAAVYGPQKGATEEGVDRLDAGLMQVGRLWRDRLGRDVFELPGAGAAGGMGGGMIAMLGAELRHGIDVVLDAVDFRTRVQGADLCLTGEGRFDAQSLHGKACFGVARIAQEHDVPTIAIAGSVAEDAPGEAVRRARGITALHQLADRVPIGRALREAAALLEQRAAWSVSVQ